ncbi:MAG TPA: trehalose-phosphatase [Chloroflexota bacterium]|nr:trehalose-phosphatase [Chloroflexota bacterium]
MYESLSDGDNASLVDHVVDLLGSGRAGVITDVDGTISPIVALPEDARVEPAAHQALQTLMQHLTLVAVVSGRTATEARHMVGLDGLTYIGNHGFEVLRAGGPEVVPAALPWVRNLAAVLDSVQSEIQQPGVRIENKGATASLHYRLAPDPARTKHDLLEVLVQRAVPLGFQIEEGRMVINVLPPLGISKGSAVSWLVAEHRLDRVVYLGDDETDTHAFRALKVLRQSGEVRTLSIAVVDRETPLSVRQLADASLPSVHAVADLLCRVAELLEPEC